jgi:S-adenosylmethionine:tRNA ribosyltransferase-isomerase
MIAANEPRRIGGGRKLLLVDGARSTLQHAVAAELAAHLAPNDLVVVNDAATLPASLRVRNIDAELRLVGRTSSSREFTAILFGPGDYHTPTEQRLAPPAVTVGQTLEFDSTLSAEVLEVDARSARLVRVRFSVDAERLLLALYRLGRPIQYAHVNDPLALWDVQNRFAARPWAFEAPSAGFGLDGEQLLRLRARGVRLVNLTHAAGISSTGAAELDALLPLPERFEIPESTARALEATVRDGGRIIAIGTSVVRALEASALEHGFPRAGQGEARLRLGARSERRVVDAVLSGMHEQGTSHFELLEAFAPARLLRGAVTEATRAGYLAHEFGDLCLVFGAPRARSTALHPAAA